MFNKETQMWDWPLPDSDYSGSWHNLQPSYSQRMQEIGKSVKYWLKWLNSNFPD